MFKLRLMSTLVLLPLAIAGILYLPNLYIMILSSAIIAIAALEWLRMSMPKNAYVLLFLLCALMAVAAGLIYGTNKPLWLYEISLVWWLGALIGVCYYPRYAANWKQQVYQPIIGIIMFVPAWLAFNTLHAQRSGPVLVLLGCALIWGADIGAYCFGKLWGKTKLLPEVSPNKTWAGLYGGLFTACIIISVYYIIYKPPFTIVEALGVALITFTFAVIGDLFESMVKRIYGVKDSGSIIPGHGGMYDRIDSMLAAFPVYFLCIQTLELLAEMKHML
ncbi:MAG TPA: phosphatidate cytidylyltransferase [Gammaproteobacteria bacterium]|nr:phosphatidate cytidylyltransferase [Gammaproteobacteria bacterium]